MTDHVAPEPSATPAQLRIRIVALIGLVATGVAAVAVARGVHRLEDVLGLILAAAALALITLPVTRWLSRIGHGLAVALTATLSLAVSIAVGYLVLGDLSTQAESVAVLISDRLDAIDTATTFGRVVDSLRIDSAVEVWLSRVPQLVVVGEETGTGIGRQLVALVTVVILAAFLQSSGEQVANWFVSLWPRAAELRPARVGSDTDDSDPAPDASPRKVVREILYDIDHRGVAVVRRTFLLASAVALLMTSVCALLDAPGAIVLGLWAGAWFVLPTIGWAIGLAPLALVAWVEGTTSVTAVFLISIALAIATTITRRRLVDRATLRLGVGPYVVAIVVGVALGGIAGSIIGLTTMAIVAAIVTTDQKVPRPSPWMVDADATRLVGGVRIPTGWRGAAVAVAGAALGVVMWVGLIRVAPAIVWLLVGTFVAVAISRPVSWMVRRFGLSHQLSIAIMLTTVALAASLLIVTGAANGARASTSVADRLPEVVRELEDSPVIGGWLRDRDAALWIENQVNDLPQRVRTLRPAELLPAVGARLLDLFWTVLVTVAMLIDGRRIVHRTTQLVPAGRRRQFTRLMGAIGAALGGYAAGAALVAGINGAVVFVIAIGVGIGIAPVLAVWAFTWNFVPQIGGFIGGIPLILFALIAGPLQALIASIAFVIYQFVENNLIQPTVIGAAIDVPPWGTLVAALAGAAAAGVIGAIVVTPLVGVIRVVRSELARDDFPGATARVNGAVSDSP
ncbi:MAG: AI-2E family transporter [Ilumatobacteraceae bacterium]